MFKGVYTLRLFDSETGSPKRFLHLKRSCPCSQGVHGKTYHDVCVFSLFSTLVICFWAAKERKNEVKQKRNHKRGNGLFRNTLLNQRVLAIFLPIFLLPSEVISNDQYLTQSLPSSQSLSPLFKIKSYEFNITTSVSFDWPKINRGLRK